MPKIGISLSPIILSKKEKLVAEWTPPRSAITEGESSQAQIASEVSKSAKESASSLSDFSSSTTGNYGDQELVVPALLEKLITPSTRLAQSFDPKRGVKLGIGITTYNRSNFLKRTIDSVRENTSLPYTLFVADDGSSDDTCKLIADMGITHISAPNRGIAWNKNRVIYYLNEIKGCDVIILLEDDTFPTEYGWERVWVDAALRYGHMNLYPSHWSEPTLKGKGSADDPYVCNVMTGQCVSFSRVALQAAGYMDTRFRRYGYEHAEHSTRLIKSGYGGVEGEEAGTLLPFLVRSSLVVTGLDQPPDLEGISQNGPIFSHLKLESAFRPAWRGDEEGAFFRFEMSTVCNGYIVDNHTSVPDWNILTASKRKIFFSKDSNALILSGEDSKEFGRVALRLTYNGCYFVTYSIFDGKRENALGIIFDNLGNVSTVESPERGTLLSIKYPANSGFGLKIISGNLLSANMLSGLISTDSKNLGNWETFHFDGYVLNRVSQ